MSILFLAGLLLMVMGSAIGVVYTKHESRKLFVELQQLNREIDELNIDWGRLQLEQSAWSSHGRIEKMARKRLNMELPAADKVVYIKR
ncbi:MAG: cell division protein FtsL [Gammaproteobacteria bacterium]|nr:cell division protein FtsL [Gammaproteobacteria bacterium]MCW8910560.1 cell division protein FtsL [Gammaproteobacteria bacterium]MCW9005404.1 cell division protein FtsL [Gammaproteobacteria bacterium]MCW9055242.1 cell division protein FtsL [Gammaproteobacteria bacterium]